MVEFDRDALPACIGVQSGQPETGDGGVAGVLQGRHGGSRHVPACRHLQELL